MTAPSFYTLPQIASILSRESAWENLQAITPATYIPKPPASFDLPTYGSVPFAEWWAVLQPLIADTDQAHQSALVGALSGNAAWSQLAQQILLAYARVNKGVATFANDSPLAWVECVAGFVYADVLMGQTWPSRSTFLGWLQRNYLPSCDNIKTRVNNWGAWGTFGAILARQRLGVNYAADVANLVAQIDAMIDPSTGKLPQEELRVGSVLWYSYYCMVPLTCAVRVVRNAGGPDYFRDPVTGERIQAAVANIIAMAESPTAASGKPPLTAINPWPYDLVAAMGDEYNRDDWRAAAAPLAPVMYFGHHTGWNVPTLTDVTGL